MSSNAPTTAIAKKQDAPLTMGEKGFNFDFDSALKFAREIIDAGMAPKGITKPGSVVGLMQAGRELGLPPMMALANLTFTNGRVGIMGDAAKALIRSGGFLEPGTDFVETYSGEVNKPSWKCTVTAHRRGHAKPFVSEFSLADAITAKLARIWTDGTVQSRTRDGYDTSGPWATYTKRMLKYRALGFLCKDHFSDVLMGCVIEEELRDYPAPVAQRDSTPPLEPDPLLSRQATDDSIIDAEISDDEPAEEPRHEPIEDKPDPVSATQRQARGLPAELEERAVTFENVMQSKNTMAGLAQVWKRGEDLRSELSVYPDRAAQVSKVYTDRFTELGGKL